MEDNIWNNNTFIQIPSNKLISLKIMSIVNANFIRFIVYHKSLGNHYYLKLWVLRLIKGIWGDMNSALCATCRLFRLFRLLV